MLSAEFFEVGTVFAEHYSAFTDIGRERFLCYWSLQKAKSYTNCRKP